MDTARPFVSDPTLLPIADKVVAGESLSFEDGTALYASLLGPQGLLFGVVYDCGAAPGYLDRRLSTRL